MGWIEGLHQGAGKMLRSGCESFNADLHHVESQGPPSMADDLGPLQWCLRTEWGRESADGLDRRTASWVRRKSFQVAVTLARLP